MKKTAFLPNPSIFNGLMSAIVLGTSVFSAAVLWSKVDTDNRYLGHINAFIAGLLVLLSLHRIYLGIDSRAARLGWSAICVLFLVLTILPFFNDALDIVLNSLGLDDLDDCLLLVLPIAISVAVRSEPVRGLPFQLLIIGFIAQVIATVLDLADDAIGPIGRISISEIVEFSEFVYLQFYFVGLALIMSSLYLRRWSAAEGDGPAPFDRTSAATIGAGSIGGPGRQGHTRRIQPILEALPKPRWLSFRVKYAAWRMVHWRGGFGEYYSKVNTGKLKRGALHRTLGTHTWQASERHAWASLPFEQRGMEILPDLTAFGLTPESVCVDYGCGSLRIGQHLIRSLEPGCYWGLDVTDNFFKPAAALLPPELIEAKQPHLHEIGEEVLARLERQPPDFVFSYAVVKHVPPKELEAFFDRFMRLIGPRTVAMIYFADAPTERITPMTWLHPAEGLIGLVLQRRGEASVGVTRIGRPSPNPRRRHPRSVLWIAGSQVDRPMPARILTEQDED